ncbi:MAG: ABC transporter permease, partial [Schleiferiaceae bacterium]|nr:ABC transporter permease [Schleiferiaceae bacterium]
NGTAVSMLIYAAYFVLRNSVDDAKKRATLAAVYNIFSFVLMVVFIGVLPRLTDSLHPGNGGNPAFSNYDLDSNMRMVFYPAVFGWILIGFWITELRRRIAGLTNHP